MESRSQGLGDCTHRDALPQRIGAIRCEEPGFISSWFQAYVEGWYWGANVARFFSRSAPSKGVVGEREEES